MGFLQSTHCYECKAKSESNRIQNLVIPRGLTLYVQAGDLAMYKSPIIAAWKSQMKLNVHVEVIQSLHK